MISHLKKIDSKKRWYTGKYDGVAPKPNTVGEIFKNSKTMKLQGKTVMILPHNNPEHMGNIKIPKTANNFMLTGDVIDIAPGVKQVQKNEKVYYNKGTRSEITLQGIQYHLVQEDYIEVRYE